MNDEPSSELNYLRTRMDELSHEFRGQMETVMTRLERLETRSVPIT